MPAATVIELENAQYFHKISSAKEVFFEEELTRRNSGDGPRTKLRVFMGEAGAAWTALSGDEQTAFVAKYRDLCAKQGVEPNEDKSEEKKEKKKKAGKKKEEGEKENSEPAENDMEVDQEGAQEEKAEKPKKKRKAEEESTEPLKEKKPQANFFRFMNVGLKGEESFSVVWKREHPDAAHKEMTAAAGEAWKAATDEVKAKLKAEYEEEMVGYKERNPAPEKEKKLKESPPKKAKTDEVKDKKPVSGYMRFMNNVFRAKFKAENPESKGISEVGKAAGEAWGAMSDEDKAEYNDEYESEMVAWRKRNGKPEPAAKEAKAPKAPKSILELYLSEEFKGKYKEEHEEAKMPEIREAAITAFEALSEEDKKDWDAKYAARLAEAGVDRAEHDLEQAKKDEVQAKKVVERKPPKDALKVFVDEQFWASFKEENPDAKKASKECTAAAKEAWAALDDEGRATWEARYSAILQEMGVDATEQAASSSAKSPAAKSPDNKPKKPKKPSARTWKKIFVEEHMAKLREKKPDLNDEQLEGEANLRLKQISKAEISGYQDKAKTEKARNEKLGEKMDAEYKEALERWEAEQKGEAMDEDAAEGEAVEGAADASEETAAVEEAEEAAEAMEEDEQ